MKICRQKIYHSDKELRIMFGRSVKRNNYVKNFENKFAWFIGTGKGYATSSATYALYMILKKYAKGSEIILPSYTNYTIPAMIICMGLKPVFVSHEFSRTKPKVRHRDCRCPVQQGHSPDRDQQGRNQGHSPPGAGQGSQRG